MENRVRKSNILTEVSEKIQGRKGADIIIEEKITENFSKLMRADDWQIQEFQQPQAK